MKTEAPIAAENTETAKPWESPGWGLAVEVSRYPGQPSGFAHIYPR